MGAALDLFSALFFSKHKISGTWRQSFSLSYKLVIPWKTSHCQAYSTKPVFHKVLLIGIILHSCLLIFCWLCPLSAFPMTVPGINAKITGLVSPASFHWLSEILAQHLLLGLSCSSSHLFFIPLSHSHFLGFSQSLKTVQRTPLLVLMFLLGTRYLGLQI